MVIALTILSWGVQPGQMQPRCVEHLLELRDAHLQVFSAELRWESRHFLRGHQSISGKLAYREQGEREVILKRGAADLELRTYRNGKEIWVLDKTTGGLWALSRRAKRRRILDAPITYWDMALAPTGYLDTALIDDCRVHSMREGSVTLRLRSDFDPWAHYYRLRVIFDPERLKLKRILFYDHAGRLSKRMLPGRYLKIRDKWLLQEIRVVSADSLSSLTLHLTDPR